MDGLIFGRFREECGHGLYSQLLGWEWLLGLGIERCVGIEEIRDRLGGRFDCVPGSGRQASSRFVWRGLRCKLRGDPGRWPRLGSGLRFVLWELVDLVNHSE